MPDFEVIVVGAGPAGAMITKDLAEKKFSVLCIEKEVEIGYTNKSTAATPLDTFETFELPRELGFDDLGGFRIFGPSASCIIEFGKVIGRLLKFREMRQFLIKEAIRSGACVMLGTTVVSAFMKDGKIAGVRYKGFEGEGMLSANVVVDASGPESVLAASLGLWQKRKEQLGVALEYFLENANPEKGKTGFYLDFFMGSNRAPGGYGWIFPTNNHEVKAGICKLNPSFHPPNEKTQKEYLQEIWKENHQIKNSQPFEIHQCAHYITGGIEHTCLDNFIGIGDAVNKVHPIWGEGNRSAFYSARFAAEAIEEARRRNDYSKKVLGLCDKLWKEKWGTNWRFSKIVYEILYNADDAQLDVFIDALQKIDPGAIWRMYLGKATKMDYLSILRRSPQFAGKKNLAVAIFSVFKR